MFWRKKQRPSELFRHETDNRRKSFRVSPNEQEPIFIRFGDRFIPIANIGALGVAFPNPGFNCGEARSASFELPGESESIDVRLEVVEISSRNICRCRFVTISKRAVDAIHRYMLNRQKEDLRSQKTRGRASDNIGSGSP